jgi:hypothetical protein
MCDALVVEDITANVGFEVITAVSGLGLLVCDAIQFGRFISMYFEDGCRRFFQNVGTHLPNYTASYPKIL